MNDYIKSAVGAEATDQSFVATNVKPLWHFTPLPLLQVRPDFTDSCLKSKLVLRQSLTSLCLSKISHNLHLFTPAALSALPPSLASRVLRRARADRGYFHGDEIQGESHNHQPDISTLWAYSAILDPEGDDTPLDHTLGLPTPTTLLHFQPNPTLAEPEHPFQSIPKRYYQLTDAPTLDFLTTLTLDGVDGIVNDQTILNLKWCTHLTVLVTKGCKISDISIRLLASSLHLPGPGAEKNGVEEGRGMWRLRAWFLPGCVRVTDKSMRSFARWPGLALLDVRDTSCTSVAMDIFNRHSRQYFSAGNADLQPCTEGLQSLFSTRATASEILESLCLTIIQRPEIIPVPREVDEGRWWLGLHLVPSNRPLSPAWLPNRHKDSSTAGDGESAAPTQILKPSVYRSGLGQVYGNNVSFISDEVRSFRSNLKTAMRIQAEDEGLCEREKSPWEMEKEWRGRCGKRQGGYSRYQEPSKKILKGFKLSQEDEDRSKGFYTGTRMPASGAKASAPKGGGARNGRGGKKGAVSGTRVDVEREAEVVKGDTECMMVRMVCDHWETLTWASAGAAAATTVDEPMAMVSSSQRPGRTSGPLVDGMLGEILLGSQRSVPTYDPSSSPILGLPAFLPSSSPPDTKPNINPFAAPKKASVNPFKQAAKPTTSMGVRPLVASQSIPNVNVVNRDPMAGVKLTTSENFVAKRESVIVKEESVSIDKSVVRKDPQSTKQEGGEKKQGNILAFFGGGQSKKRESNGQSGPMMKKK